MVELAVQLYTLRNLEESLTETIERVAQLPYDGVQFAGIDGASVDALASTLESTGLSVAGAHVGVDRIEDDYDAVADAYHRLDCDELVVPSYERDAFASEEGARGAAEHLSAAADRVGDDGFELHYHNHTFEFTDLGSRTGFEAFADAADGVLLELDAGLARHAGADPVALLERYGDRISLVHLTDTRPGSDDTLHVDLGDGVVDVAACVDAAREADVDWLIYENGLTDEPAASVERAAETLTAMLS